MADHDVSKMKVADLKRELKIRGLHTTGNKNELVERLQSALIEGDVFDETGISEDLLDDNDDVLNDDELDEETKSFLNSSAHDEDAILKSPHGSTSSKSPENAGLVDSSSAAAAQHKKVVLKRKLITSLSVNESNSNDAPTDAKVLKTIEPSGDNANNGTHADDVPSTGTVKLKELSMKERLELRAKKFGATPSTDTLKQARAERFGIPASATKTGATTAKSGSSDSIKKDVVAPPIDLLKKRAERFGGSVSTVLTKMENKEKLLKRQERFGAVKAPTASQPSTETPDTSQPNSGYAEKAKLRLERFKTTVK